LLRGREALDPALVQRVCGVAELGGLVHLLGPDLHLEWEPGGMLERGVDRGVAVGFGLGHVVFEASLWLAPRFERGARGGVCLPADLGLHLVVVLKLVLDANHDAHVKDVEHL